MTRLASGLAILGVLLLTASTTAAQAPAQGGRGGRGGQGAAAPPPPPPPPPQNLQVLPKDIAVPDLLTTMRSFAAALGVNCGYCHVWEAGGQNNDMPSDAKAPKQTARAMLTMTRDLNAALAKGLNRPVTQVAQVRCITCHRGAAIPTAE